MYEVNVGGSFLGLPEDPATHGHIFRRFRKRIWERYNHEYEHQHSEGRGQWQKITDDNVLDALEAGYKYGREYYRWQISQLTSN